MNGNNVYTGGFIRRSGSAIPALIAAFALAVLLPVAAQAEAPSPAAPFQNAKPLTAGPGLGTDQTGKGADVVAAPDQGADTLPQPSVVRPTRVWTTDRYGRARMTFLRGESIVFWVQLYNPTRAYARHALELWADDQIRCITAPCRGGPQRLFAGTVWVRPGYTNYYLFARAELDDKVGEWNYYATDPEGRTFLATKFYLR